MAPAAAAAAWSELRVKLRVALSAVGALVGASVFAVWSLHYGQPYTGACGGLSGVLAIWTLVTHVMYIKDYWRTWIQGLRFFFTVGVSFQVIALVGFITFLALAISAHQALTDPTSLYITCIWCLMTLKWAFFLSYYAHHYHEECADVNTLDDI
ncbi:heme transporter HRG1 [Lethenteron reissneri]|uniref:heme transporter HRG1 n=1 Tax=Lethenteron reissneri TaxID=7753 RepID=UPI002AB79ECD|nr:heme transporter HRG1 [Lethenteron reissneri]